MVNATSFWLAQKYVSHSVLLFLSVLNFPSFLHFSILDMTFISRWLFVTLCVCLAVEKNKSFTWETTSSGFLFLSFCLSFVFLFFYSSGSLKWVIPFMFTRYLMSHLIGSLQPSSAESRMDFITFCFVIFLFS